jgi:hypothetical protein
MAPFLNILLFLVRKRALYSDCFPKVAHGKLSNKDFSVLDLDSHLVAKVCCNTWNNEVTVVSVSNSPVSIAFSKAELISLHVEA